MISLGFREDSKEEEPEREEKEKEKEVEDFSDLETKVKEKEKEKEKVTLQEMKVIGLKMYGMKQRIGMKAIGPMKMKQHGNPKPGMNGKKITMTNTDISKEKERKERKVMDLKIKEKDKVMGKVKQIM